MTIHPESLRLADGLAHCRVHSCEWTGIVYRSVSPRYANTGDLLSGVGAKTAGGRWNPPRSFRTIYASTDPHMALDEVLAHFRHYHLDIATAMPRVIVSVEVHLHRLLYLTDRAIRRRLGVSRKRIMSEAWRELQAQGRESLTQAIGRLTHAEGWDGMLVPSSSRGEGKNLVIFPENFVASDSRLEIINESELLG